MKHSVRLAIAFFLLSTIPVAFVTLVSTINAERTIEREVARHLEAITGLQAADLDRWLGTLERTIESIAQRPLFVDLSEELSRQSRGETASDPEVSAQLLDVHLYPLLRAGGTFEALSIIDVNSGQVLVSTDRDQVGKFRVGEAYFEGGMSGTFFDRIRFVPALETMAFHVSTPVSDRGASPLALLVGRADLRVFSEIITHDADSHTTEDVYLVNAQGIFVTEPRYGEGFALRRYAGSEGALRAVSGETGVASYEDYRGVPVLGAFRWLPETNLGMLAEIDRWEVLAMVGQTRGLSYGLLAGAVVLFTLLGASTARQLTHPLRRIAAGATRVGRGEFDHRISSTRKDEFGDLARAFDRMTENLQRITASRDDLQLEIARRERAEARLRDSLAALEQSESLFRLLSEASPIGICIWQGEFFAYVNPALERILGYSSEELIGKTDSSDVVSREDRDLILRYVERIRTSGVPQEPLRFRARRMDGTIVPCEGYARPIEYGGRPAVLGTIIDVSLLRQAEERFRMAAHVASDLIYEWDVSTDVLTWHADIDAKLGCPRGTIAHTIEAWVSRIHPEDQVRLHDAVERHRTTVEPISQTYRIRHEDGSWRHWIDRGVPVLDAEGRPVRWIGVCIDETERILAYRARVESEERFHRILESAPDVIYRYRLQPDPGFDYISEAIETVTGHRPEELVNQPDVGSKLLYERDQRFLDRLLEGETRGELPHPHQWRHKDGHPVWIEDVHVMIRDAEGRPVAIEGIARDITERIEAELALRTADDIVRSLPTGLLILRKDSSGGFVVDSANAAACGFIAEGRGSLEGCHLDELFPPDMVARVSDTFTSVLASGIGYEDEVVIRADQSIRFAVHLRVFTIPEGRLVAAFEDITRQKQAEESLRISEQQHRSLFENAALGIYKTTPDGRILAANPALIRMLGFESFEELARRNLETDGYEPETPREEFKRSIAEKGRIEGRESVWICRDGRRLVVRENAVAVRDDDGNVIFYEGTVEDITAQREAESERERLEARLRQSQKLESIGTLASGVAHEINNPLTGILLFSSNMSKKVPAKGPLQDGFKIIIRETQRCKTIIQGLLDFARDSQPQKTEADINVIMLNSIAVVENEFHLKHVSIDNQLAREMVETYLDENQIMQVFINILLNALQASEKNSRVKIQSHVNYQEGLVGMTISDDGCGMSPDELENIFDPFFSTKAQGTGLGLAVSYGIVKNHEGTIKAYSEPGRGTHFVVELPIATGIRAKKDFDETQAYTGH